MSVTSSLKGRFKFAFPILFALGLSLWLTAYLVQYRLRLTPLQAPHGSALSVRGIETFSDIKTWNLAVAPKLRAEIQKEIYGTLPTDQGIVILSRSTIKTQNIKGAGSGEKLLVSTQLEGRPQIFEIIILYPKSATAPTPFLVAPNFCGNAAALRFGVPDLKLPNWQPDRCKTATGRALAELLHGDAILSPPYNLILDAGFSVVTFDPFDVIPDNPIGAQQVLRPSTSQVRHDYYKSGAIAGWAWLYSRVLDATEQVEQLDQRKSALWGHSRFAKAALLSAAFDPRATLIIANQSGTLGATPTDITRGESKEQLLNRFPYWFTPTAQSGDFAQQDLLALIAPRPLLLGGGTMDRWSDPASAFVAALSTRALYCSADPTARIQKRFETFAATAQVASYLRAGGHGVRGIDWIHTRDFMRAHFDTSVGSLLSDTIPCAATHP